MKDLTWVFSNTRLKVSIHGDQSSEKGLVAGTYPSNSLTKRFEEQVAGTWPKNSNQFEFVRLVAWTNLRDQILKQKWPVHTMGLALKWHDSFNLMSISFPQRCLAVFLFILINRKYTNSHFSQCLFLLKYPLKIFLL